LYIQYILVTSALYSCLFSQWQKQGTNTKFVISKFLITNFKVSNFIGPNHKVPNLYNSQRYEFLNVTKFLILKNWNSCASFVYVWSREILYMNFNS
jgi:hypothetical protein